MQETIFEYIIRILPQMLAGLSITIKLFVVTLVFSLPLGLLVSLLNESVSKRADDKFVIKWFVKFPVRLLINIYLWVFRGTPLLLQLFFFYFGLAMIELQDGTRLAMEPFMAASLTFILNYAAYFAEIFRGGIIGVSKGQYEASKALGLNSFQTMRFVVIPQMLRTVVPPVANEAIVLVKDTALVSSIALIDMLKKAQQAVSRDMNVTAFFVVAVIYLAITLVLTYFFSKAEKKLSISERKMV